MTVPFDLKRLYRFSPLKVRTLRQTKPRWCWFEKASEDDREAGTRLGTLRYLPYEIRQHIFTIVLEGYIDDFNQKLKQHEIKWNHRFGHKVSQSELKVVFEGDGSCCAQEQMPDVLEIFDLITYFGDPFPRDAGLLTPLSLRFASPSIQPEFDFIFFTSCTFEFDCPTALETFLDLLSPSQKRQLRSLRLYFFDREHGHKAAHDRWLALCLRLPPSIMSVEFVVPEHWYFVVTCWSGLDETDGIIGVAADLLIPLCEKTSRALPSANIFWTDPDNWFAEGCGLLNAVPESSNPGGSGMHTWVNGVHKLI